MAAWDAVLLLTSHAPFWIYSIKGQIIVDDTDLTGLLDNRAVVAVSQLEVLPITFTSHTAVCVWSLVLCSLSAQSLGSSPVQSDVVDIIVISNACCASFRP